MEQEATKFRKTAFKKKCNTAINKLVSSQHISTLPISNHLQSHSNNPILSQITSPTPHHPSLQLYHNKTQTEINNSLVFPETNKSSKIKIRKQNNIFQRRPQSQHRGTKLHKKQYSTSLNNTQEINATSENQSINPEEVQVMIRESVLMKKLSRSQKEEEFEEIVRMLKSKILHKKIIGQNRYEAMQMITEQIEKQVNKIDSLSKVDCCIQNSISRIQGLLNNRINQLTMILSSP